MESMVYELRKVLTIKKDSTGLTIAFTEGVTRAD